MRLALLLAATLAAGCATVEPGHLGLLFNSQTGGLHHDILKPGMHYTGAFGRIEDFDVTYSTRKEGIQTASSEGLGLNTRLAVIFRPVVSELYDLDSDIGLNYYDEIIGPEFRSAARGVFARHSYLELLRHNEEIENEIESDLRRRIAGKHVEISSVTMEAVEYAPEIGKAVQDKLVAEQDAFRQKTLLENEGSRRRLELQYHEEQSKMSAEAALREKSQETELAKQQAMLDRVRQESEAEKRLITARAQAAETKLHSEAEAEQIKLLALAHADENKALTPLSVMLRGYQALEALGNKDAHIMLGDWSQVPNFLFPAAFQSLASPSATQPAVAHKP
jgi:regulator of protease activity HflC (stomatin/prohibitin superfamily)